MIYASVVAGAAICLLLVSAKGLPTKEESCAKAPKGSVVVLLDCPPRPATSY